MSILASSWRTVASLGARLRRWWEANPGCSSPSPFGGRRARASCGSSPPPASASPRMSEIELRVPLGVGQALRDVVFRRGRHEYVAIGLVSHARLGDRDVLLLRQLFEIPESAYRLEAGHGAAWNGTAMIPAIATAVDLGLGIVVFHAHPHDGLPELSGDDRGSANRLIPMFRARVPARPHGSIVLSRTHAAGLVSMPGGDVATTKTDVRWLGASIIDWRTAEARAAPPDPGSFARQLLLVRDDGQRTLANARVGVVGLGGGGGHVAPQPRAPGPWRGVPVGCRPGP